MVRKQLADSNMNEHTFYNGNSDMCVDSFQDGN